MRGHYRLDETGNGKDTLRFRQGGKTILTVYLRQDHLTFLVVLGQKERELFEAHREAFLPFFWHITTSPKPITTANGCLST